MIKIVAVDLDGCLCSINSFRWWMLFSFCYLFISFRWVSCLKFLRAIIQRLLGEIDRVQMKRNILMNTENIPTVFIKWFCRFLDAFTNKKVLAEMHRYEDAGASIVLCTAAPACYVYPFATGYKFSSVFATPSVFEAGWKENIGDAKLDMLETCFGSGFRLECIITDHHDDLPLLLKAERRLLVNPSRKTLDIIAGHFDFDII